MIYWPDYKGGSIVNLMSSIASACGEKTSYPNLKHLPKEELRNYKNIVLIIIDALGWDYLQNKKDSFLYKNIRNKITSVALPTTACAITTFLTGYPPQQTAVTGWHINIKELGGVTTILPFVPRAKGSFDEKKIKIREILDKNGIFKNIKRKCFIVSPKEINHCQYNLYHTRGAKVIDTKNINSFFSKIERVIKKQGKKYIYAYWPDFDSLCHEYGKESKKVKKHFNILDKKIKNLSKNIKDSILIITADHGSTSIPTHKRILLGNHPQLREYLTLPLCGDAKTKYCYVHPSKSKQFEEYIKNNLSEYCEFYKTEELINKNLFGLGKPNPKLFDRLGDYILVMKGNNVLKETILGEKDNKHIGNHGGLTKEEMEVPLVIIKS